MEISRDERLYVLGSQIEKHHLRPRLSCVDGHGIKPGLSGFLLILVWSFRDEKSDGFPVGGPGIFLDPLRRFDQRLRLALAWPENKQLRLSQPGREKCYGLAVRRPSCRHIHIRSLRDGITLVADSVGKPYIGLECIPLPIDGCDIENDLLTRRGYRDRPDRPQ